MMAGFTVFETKASREESKKRLQAYQEAYRRLIKEAPKSLSGNATDA